MKNLIACFAVCVLSGSAFTQAPVTYWEIKLLASDGASFDYFGGGVSISSDGSTAIVGAAGDSDNGTSSGSVYIYSLVQGVWEEAKIIASDGATGDLFGAQVSISSDGSTAIVGARGDDDNGTNSGSVYIYSLVQGVWEETKIIASDGTIDEYFGGSLSISSDGFTAVVGVRSDDDNGTNSGSVYIYSLVQGVWEETKLIASDGAIDDYFGGSLSISSDGSTAIVGATGDGDNGTNSGSVYIYSLVQGVWEETKLIAVDGAFGDRFGVSVSISSDGSTAIVGAVGDDYNGSWTGSVYIYSLVQGIWEETKLIASDGASVDYFGQSVSISSDGTTAIVGATGDGDNGANSGSVYIYSLVKGVWEETKLIASDGATGDNFSSGVSISSDGSTAIVGAVSDGSWAGSAYIFGTSGSQYNACCVTSGCDIVTELMCLNLGGTYIVNGSCDDCVTPPACIGDLDGNGEVNVADLLLLIGAWGACP